MSNESDSFFPVGSGGRGDWCTQDAACYPASGFTRTEISPGTEDGGSSDMPVGLFERVYDEYTVPEDSRRKLHGYFATLNGLTVWDIMKSFDGYAEVYSASEALYGEGYYDSVLMKKMILWVSAKRQKYPVIGDVYVSSEGYLYAYVGKTQTQGGGTVKRWEKVAEINLTGDWSVPQYNVGRYVSNKPSQNPPSGANGGDFLFKTFDGTTPGFFIYKYDVNSGWQKLDETSTDVIRFSKHIEIDISRFPCGTNQNGGRNFSFVRCDSASSALTSTSERVIVDVNWWGAEIARYRGTYTNEFSMALTSIEEPTTFVMDASSLLPASPMRVDNFDGSFSFVMMRAGTVAFYTYTKDTDTSEVNYQFYSGNPLPAEFHGLVYNPPSPIPQKVQQKTCTDRAVYTFSVPYVTAKASEPDEQDETKYEMALTATTVTPYKSVQSSYHIPEDWLMPEVAVPGAGPIYVFPADVVRTMWAQDSTQASIYDNANLTYTSGTGAFSLVAPIFNSDTSEYDKWYDHGPDYLDDNGVAFPDIWVYGVDSNYHMASIYVGLGLKTSETSGINKTTVKL